MASFDDTYSNEGGGEGIQPTSRPFDDGGGYTGYEFDAPADATSNINSDMHSGGEAFGFGSSPSPNPEYSPSPFESAPVAQSNGESKPYDLGGDDTNGIFTSNDGPLLPDPSEMREEGAAYREWRR